jgi:hypothetical protein
MRFVLSFVFIASLSVWLVANIPAQLKEPAKDKEKRIAEIQQEIAGHQARIAALEAQLIELQAGTSLDLFALLDLKRDTVAGDWKWKDKKLMGPGTPDAKLAFPVRPSGDYQFTVKFKRTEGLGGPILCLPVGDRHVNFALDAYNGEFTALEAVDGAYVNFPANPTQVRGKHIVTNKSHSLQATVQRKGDNATIRIDLDGKRLVDWTGNPNRFSLHPAWRLNDDRQLGLRSWQVFEFESAQLRMMTGQANPVRP